MTIKVKLAVLSWPHARHVQLIMLCFFGLALLLCSCKSRSFTVQQSAAFESAHGDADQLKNVDFLPLVAALVAFSNTSVAQAKLEGFIRDGNQRFTYPKDAESWHDIDFVDHLRSKNILPQQPERNVGIYLRNIKHSMAIVGLSAESWSPDEVFQRTSRLGFIVPVPQPGVGKTLGTMLTFLGPIGDYGPNHTQRLAVTAYALAQLALTDEFGNISSPLIRADNFRFPLTRKINDDETERERYSDPLRTLVEGILTTYQALNLLTDSKFKSYSADDLVRRLIESPSGNVNGFIAKFASAAPVNFIGPNSHAAYVFPNPLLEKASGDLTLVPTLYDIMKRLRAKCISRFMSGENSPVSCNGCPLARLGPGENKTSSVQLIANLFRETWDRAGP